MLHICALSTPCSLSLRIIASGIGPLIRSMKVLCNDCVAGEEKGGEKWVTGCRSSSRYTDGARKNYGVS